MDFRRIDIPCTVICIIGAASAPALSFARSDMAVPAGNGPLVVYVDPNGANVYPYTNPDNASTSIWTAIETVYGTEELPGEVRIAPGTYSETEGKTNTTNSPMYALRKPVRLIGTGPSRADVVLDARGKCQVLYIDHPKATVENLTLANGDFSRFLVNQASGNLILKDGVVTNCVIRDGYGMTCGQALAEGGRISGCDFIGGTLAVSGSDRPSGGLNIFGPAKVDHCRFYKNEGGYGAGLYMHSSASGAIVRNCEFYDNECLAKYGGGGVAIRAGLLDCCVITNNHSKWQGAGIILHGGEVRNCVIANNLAFGPEYDNGGGGGAEITGGTMVHCTLYGNRAGTRQGHDLLLRGGMVRNTIISPGLNQSPDACIYKVGGTISHSVVPVEGLGETLIVTDPMFISPEDGDFALLFASPCIDRGEPLEEVTVDLLGNPRPIGTGYDIGCLEMELPQGFTISFSADTTHGADKVDACFTVLALNGTGTITYTWDFGDGIFPESTTSSTIYHSFLPGSFDITLTARDSAGNEVSLKRPGYVNVRAGTVYVSNEGKAVWPYDNWENATPILQDAIEAVYSSPERPGIVKIADGSYGPRNEGDPFIAVLQRPVHLIGAGADHGAVLDAESYKNRRVILIDHPEARLENLACANGNLMSPNSGGVWLNAGTCSNVVIRSCNGFEGGLSIRGGHFTDGVISNCLNTSHGGPDRLGGGACVRGGIVERTLITNCVNGRGGAVYLEGATAVVRDCRLLGCDNYRDGPVYIKRGLVERCLIQGNRNMNDWDDRFQESAVYATGGNSIIRNCVIVGNSAVQKDGGQCAALIENGAQSINNDIVGNIHAETLAVGVVANRGGVVVNTIADSIETTEDGIESANYSGPDPVFRNPEGGDYSLRSTSPCLNAGDNSYWLAYEDPVDFNGAPRIRFGRVDIGAYEYAEQIGTLLIVR